LTTIIIKQCLVITLYLGADDTFAKIWIVYFQKEEKNQKETSFGNLSKTSFNILLR